jgi:hypothetical protein
MVEALAGEEDVTARTGVGFSTRCFFSLVGIGVYSYFVGAIFCRKKARGETGSYPEGVTL